MHHHTSRDCSLGSHHMLTGTFIAVIGLSFLVGLIVGGRSLRERRLKELLESCTVAAVNDEVTIYTQDIETRNELFELLTEGSINGDS